MSTKKVVVFFIIFTVLNLLISYFASKVIPYAGNFPYKENLSYSPLPDFMNAFANFDGMLYIRIARQNYSQFEQAFFPAYPLFIRFVTANSQTLYYLLVGLLTSAIYCLLGLLVFNTYLGRLLDSKTKVMWSLIFLLTFPTSFFFNGVYTESMFFFFIVSAFYFLHKKNYVLAGIIAYAGALTRIVGVFLIIPFLVILAAEIYAAYKNNRIFTALKQNLSLLFASFLPLLGFGTYSFYLWKTSGDPLLFFHSQTAFSAGRQTSLILFPQVMYRYLKIFFTADFNFIYFIAIIEFLFFMFALTILSWQLYKLVKNRKNLQIHLLSLNLFSMASLLLPTLTGTFLSIPRFIIVMPAIFVALAELKSFKTKVFITIIFAVLHIILLGYFVQGYFIS